jgi:L-ascorbate metabolism protein UlaG (beta-lactamase superfamily)
MFCNFITLSQRRIFLLLLLCLASSACAASPYYDAKKAHHTPYGFRNPEVNDTPNTKKLLRFMLEVMPEIQKNKKASVYVPEYRNPDLAKIAQPPKHGLLATWIGHSSFLLQVNGQNILTDPIFSKRASPVGFAGPERLSRAGLTPEELPPINMVLISHSHYDHLDEATILKLGNAPIYVVPLGLKAWLNKRNITNVIEFDWWDQLVINGLKVTCIPAQHWSNRGIADFNQTLWSGWAVSAADFQFYFAGDTGYTKQFKEIHPKLGAMDLALLPIGAYEPREFMRNQHVSPVEAVQMHKDVRARNSIGMHWGTFMLAAEKPEKTPIDLYNALDAAKISRDKFSVMAFGETRFFKSSKLREKP